MLWFGFGWFGVCLLFFFNKLLSEGSQFIAPRPVLLQCLVPVLVISACVNLV